MTEPNRDEDDRSGLARALRSLGPLLNAGLQITVGIGILGFLGYAGDHTWGTSPWLMVTGIFFGAGAGLYQFIRTVLALDRKNGPDSRAKG
ncbi:MAG TPA: AtpZ/AtpI family protein [Bacteroidota bacterium]|nr:AtpZ/AtpI family protein [Bacteroidota bacterium]